jgi:hypothetical protein
MPDKTKEHVAMTLDSKVIEAIDAERGLVKRSTYVNSLLATLLEKRKVAA